MSRRTPPDTPTHVRMGRSTGLRNRRRSGRSRYSTGHKGREADYYGSYLLGRRTKAEVVAGRTLSATTTPEQ